MILIITILSNIWVHWIMNPLKIKVFKHFKKAPARYRPFDCESCLSLWITGIYYLYIGQYWQSVLFAGLAYFISGLISKLFVLYLNRFYARVFKRFF